MARKRATLSDLLNDLTFRCLYDKYKLIAINAFKWDGLPVGVLERHIERVLFRDGKAICFTRTGGTTMVLPVEDGGNLNVYGDPLWYRAHGFNFQQQCRADECVIIENNKLRIPTRDFILFYVNKLTEAERTMDVNIKACKTPVVFTCDDNDLLSFKRMFNQVDGNVPAIFADKGLHLDSIQAFMTGVKFMGNELQDYANSVENKLLTFLGVNNSAVDKKERLITDEANANNELIGSFLDLQLEARQRACEEINAMFGLNVSVSRRQQAVENSVEEVENNEPVQSAV